ncbi:NADPH-dependent FMN reductase [Nonomuraea sp. NPDC049714]|jgi:NAD(P)H-dependent FMN reductase|uniref:NADPH-dependent FMN reductase n=1 Tax=Nonomuraea sp. NPDC049714 TaxID=3364357 RepID=UPI003793B3E2
MSDRPLHLALIVGSTRAGRFGPTVAAWFAEQAAARQDVVVDLIDLAQARLPAHLTGEPGAEDARALAAVSERLTRADGFVVVTPEYNHSYPASLKSAIDWHFTEWQAKPVGFISYGGVSGGLRAVEHLRQVFAELHAVTIRDTVSFHGAAYQFTPDGRPKDPASCEAAATRLLDQFVWWARALRSARSHHPYAA